MTVLMERPELPDMVFAANGGLVIGGRALGARFAYPRRAAEAPAYLDRLRGHGLRSVTEAAQVNEGEDDFLVVGTGTGTGDGHDGQERLVLAGTGFRTTPAAHDEVLADASDAAALGLNAVSDGRHVVLAERAAGLAAQLRERGFSPVGVDLSELHKAGGGAKCRTLEIRS
ncbi:MAG: hypothetical protein J2P20_11310 [Pseudonocardia sp.]|nr:hypothetical protein [Pseudonocardia sp.]MBO0873978.1 hypothetical protein [Pseudonocardia sp.]